MGANQRFYMHDNIGIPQDHRPQAVGGRCISSILEHHQSGLDVQPHPDVRPQSFTFQCRGTTYRIDFQTEDEHSGTRTKFTEESQSHRYITAVIKTSKRVRFQFPPKSKRHRSHPSILKTHSKSRPQPSSEDAVVQIARAKQKDLNNKTCADEGGYHDWIRRRDSKASQHEQVPQLNHAPPGNHINKYRPSADYLSMQRECHGKYRLSPRYNSRLLSPRPLPQCAQPPEQSRKHVRILSPRPFPVRFYPKVDLHQSVRENGELLPPVNLVSSNLAPKPGPLSYVQASRLKYRQPTNITNSAPFNTEAPVDARKPRNRLRKKPKMEKLAVY